MRSIIAHKILFTLMQIKIISIKKKTEILLLSFAYIFISLKFTSNLS
jgi:hypothetical protein